MTNPQITRIPIAKTGMLTRKTVEHVFEAIVNPRFTAGDTPNVVSRDGAEADDVRERLDECKSAV